MPATRIEFEGHDAWLKQPEPSVRLSRRLGLRLLGVVARALRVPALRPPRHHAGADALTVERRRLRELAALGVRVPPVLDEPAGDRLCLGDLGRSLAWWLRRARGDEARTDRLARLAAGAIGEVHARGGYLGQPVPRNIVFDGRRIGFIDFEEDPLEVMSLPAAQSRDWLLFVFGVAPYFPDRREALAAALGEALRSESAPALAALREAGEHLAPVSRIPPWLGRPALAAANAVLAIRTGLELLPPLF